MPKEDLFEFPFDFEVNFRLNLLMRWNYSQIREIEFFGRLWIIERVDPSQDPEYYLKPHQVSEKQTVLFESKSFFSKTISPFLIFNPKIDSFNTRAPCDSQIKLKIKKHMAYKTKLNSYSLVKIINYARSNFITDGTKHILCLFIAFQEKYFIIQILKNPS